MDGWDQLSWSTQIIVTVETKLFLPEQLNIEPGIKVNHLNKTSKVHLSFNKSIQFSNRYNQPVHDGFTMAWQEYTSSFEKLKKKYTNIQHFEILDILLDLANRVDIW